MAGDFMAGNFLAGNFMAHRVTFGDFMAGNFLAGDFLGGFIIYMYLIPKRRHPSCLLLCRPEHVPNE